MVNTKNRHESSLKMRINIFTSVFILAIGLLLPSALFEVALAEESEEPAPPNGESSRTRDEQDRHIKIEIERQKMESAKRLMDKKLIELEDLRAMMAEENNIVTVAEVKTAEEDYERAVSEYEQAKLTLQQVELESLQDEWHISVEATSLSESHDGRELFEITLRNSSSPVKLVESSKVVGQDIIISAQIDDIFVTIREQEGYGSGGAIITEPYERRIETLKEDESVTLEFELIKENIRDVVVELKYAGR